MWTLKWSERWAEVFREEVDHEVGGIHTEEEAGFAEMHQSSGQPEESLLTCIHFGRFSSLVFRV